MFGEMTQENGGISPNTQGIFDYHFSNPIISLLILKFRGVIVVAFAYSIKKIALKIHLSKR